MVDKCACCATLKEAWPTPLRIERTCRPYFLVLPPYVKPYLTVEDQLSLLSGRGMIMPADFDQAVNWLRRIGYYRLSGYWYPFRERDGEKVLETFRGGTELAHAFNLYVFDKRLRLLMLDAIERVEVGFRVEIALLIGKVDPWAHRSPQTFNRYFNEVVDPTTSGTRHADWLSRLDELCGRSREDFAKHFRAKYSGHFPIWIAVELWDFGTLSNLINGLHDKHVQPLAERYGLPRRTMLVSWIRCLNFVRNVCAHHGRLWNRPLIDQPAPPRKDEIPLLQHWLPHEKINSRLYAAASILQYFLRSMSPQSAWGNRLHALIDEFPGGPGLRSCGFPSDWHSQDLWINGSATAALPSTAR
jgi:abortive infection bacteriophage resistance protein